MRAALTFAALAAASLSAGQPTRWADEAKPGAVEATAAAGAGTDSANQGTAIPLQKRGGKNKLTLPNGAVDFARAQAHLAKTHAKFARTAGALLQNLEPEEVEHEQLVERSEFAEFGIPSPGLDRRDVWGTGEESSLEWPTENPFDSVPEGGSRILARGAGVFSGAGKGAPPVPSSPVTKRWEERSAQEEDDEEAHERWRRSNKSSEAEKGKKRASKEHKFSGYKGVIEARSTSGVEALTAYTDEMIWAGTVSIGTPAKQYLIDFDTGSADLWIPSSACTSAACNAHAKYDAASSSSSKHLSTAKLSIAYGDGSSTSGPAYTDKVKVAGLLVKGQTFGAATYLSSDWSSDPMDGLLGMAYSSISTLGAPTFFENLVSSKAVKEARFSFKLGSSGSELYLGGANAKQYVKGSTVWAPVTSKTYWTVTGSAFVGSKAVLKNFNAIVDTGTSVIVGPVAAVKQFWASVPNSGVYGGGYYTYNCADAPSIAFSFGKNSSHKWRVSAESLNLGTVSEGSTRCVGAIVGADLGLNGWVLGDSFLENVYTTFDLGANRVGFSTLK